MKIYIESLIITNAVMYLTFLIIIASFFKFKIRPVRLAISCIVAGITSFVFTLPFLSNLEIWLYQLTIIAFVLSFSYNNFSIKNFLPATIVFVILSNLFSTIFSFTTKTIFKSISIIYSPLPLIVSLIVMIITGLIFKRCLDIVFFKKKKSSNMCEVLLEYKDKKISTFAYLDTGNNLMYNTNPVSIIGFDLFSKLTNVNLEDFLNKNFKLEDYDYININSLTGDKKLLMIKLKNIKIKINKKYQEIINPQVAVSLKLVNKDYKIILNNNYL